MLSVPLHTRVISLRLRWSGPREVFVDGRLIDLRKRSIVPLGASLRGPGVVHDMCTRVWVDVDKQTISRVDPEMRTFPYVSSEHTGGENCAGPIDAVQGLVGTRLDDSYPKVVHSLIGGPRGCFHIFTLLRLTGPAVLAALADYRVQTRLGGDSPVNPGETLWARSVSVDAFKGEGLGVSLHGTLTDTFQRGGPPEDGFAAEELLSGMEVMADFQTSFPDLELAEVSGRRRQLLPGFGNAGAWEELSKLKQLEGVGARKGFSLRVQEILDDEAGRRPETHLLFMMAPVVMQSLPGLIEEMDLAPGKSDRRSSTSSATNSCHMWRSDGPLDRMTSGAAPPQKPER